MTGELVRTLVDEDKDSGTYTVNWNGRNDASNIVASVTYLVLMKTAETKSIKKIIIIK